MNSSGCHCRIFFIQFDADETSYPTPLRGDNRIADAKKRIKHRQFRAAPVQLDASLRESSPDAAIDSRWHGAIANRCIHCAAVPVAHR